MKLMIFATLALFSVSPAFSQQASPPKTPPAAGSVDLLLKQACGNIIALAESRMAEAKTQLAQIEAAKMQMKADFIYPQAALAGLNFRLGAPTIHELMSAETVALAAKYNMVYQQVDRASNIPEAMRPEMKRELQRTYGDQLATLIARDLAAAIKDGGTMRNGNRIEDTTMTWGIYYAPTGDIPALAVRQLVRTQNYEPSSQTGKPLDPLKSVSVTIEMHYNPFTNVFTHLPKSVAAEDVEPMFKRKENQLQSGYFFFTDNLEQSAKSQFDVSAKDPEYQECKKLKP